MSLQENQELSRKRLKALADTDSMSPALRACVHEFGMPIVQACLQVGVRNPSNIRQLVREIWDGARQLSQNRSPTSMLDWILMKAECGLTGRTLARVLEFNNMAIISTEPTKAMIEASMAECSTFQDRVTKREKHIRRLRAALKAGALK